MDLDKNRTDVGLWNYLHKTTHDLVPIHQLNGCG